MNFEFRLRKLLTDHTMSRLSMPKNGRQSEIPDFYDAMISINEDVIAFEISVDHRRFVTMEVVEPSENLP